MAKLELVRAEYQGTEIQFNESGWFNATQAAERFGKRPNDWLNLDSTKEYLAAFERKYGKIPYLKTRKGGNKREGTNTRNPGIGGTWMCRELVVPFARWLDVDFSVWCDGQILDILSGKHPVFDWKRSRHKSSATFQVMNDILKHVRAEIGKATEMKNYVNEANLINGCLTGKFRPPEGGRDGLPLEDLDLVVKLEERNTVLIGRGLNYAERKSILIQFMIDLRPAPLALAQ